jgi:twitching motility two-component system response regulator PilH
MPERFDSRAFSTQGVFVSVVLRVCRSIPWRIWRILGALPGSCWPLVTGYCPPGSLTYDEGQVTFAIFPSAEEPLARKILLADDSVTAQNMGRKILADAGYEVITVNNGSAALKKIAEQRPDLIVLDVYMPGYSGLEVCQRLKETGETARIPVLLTVGKLEPFKPEEAKRARADAFIVKPFEASELLSALAKLEDKIVPRSEGSKPGRFARSIAAIEEGRYDKTAAPDEDAGWKSRINFPSAKKKATEQENSDDPAIYNPVNKDLRTVVQSSVQASTESSATDTRVDLSALAPQGLPKDVTPEEIAALAAAAAQVQGGMAAKDVAAEPAAAPPAVAEAAKIEAKPEVKPEPLETSAPVVLPTETNLKPAEIIKESTEVPTSRLVEVLASIPSVESAANSIATSSSPSIVASSIAAAMQESAPASDEPVTMALAAGLETLQRSHRWSAVTAPLSTEESSASLENEMQKAFAAFAAAEGASAPIAGNSDSSATTQPGITSTAIVSSEAVSEPNSSALLVTESAAAGPVSEKRSTSESSDAATPNPEVSPTAVTETLAAVASAATEAISAAIQELESTAAAHVERSATPSSTEPVSVPAPESQQDGTPLGSHSSAATAQVTSQPGGSTGETSNEHNKNSEASSTPKPEESLPPAVQAQSAESAVTNMSGSEVEALKDEVAAEVSPENLPVMAKAETHSHSDHGGHDEMAKKESEIAATTAAAWASWRRIRETGNSKGSADADTDLAKAEAQSDIPEDRAAMAAAAGAERSPEDVSRSAESDPEIASIVDSVLADLRPKIVEEISRKLGKKK